jgi:hypothetical protein
VQVTSNQAVDLLLLPNEDDGDADGDSAAPLEVAAAKGTTSLCLPRSGSFTLTPRGCYIFGSGASFPVTVGGDARPPVLQLVATGAYVSGQLVVAAPASPSSQPLPEALTVWAQPGGTAVTATQVNPELEPGVYTYTLPVQLDAPAVVITPSAPPGSHLLFRPESVTYDLVPHTKGCPAPVVTLHAYRGVTVSGATEPPVAGEA